jgi:undecaprenyl diphosphate synthase
MDGNGRWAQRRRLPRLAGHRAGVEAIRRTVEAAPLQGIATLTLYAFSSDNWRRPQAEVESLMALLRFYLTEERENFLRNSIRVTLIGRRDRLPAGLPGLIARTEAETAHGTRLHLRIAVDYSGREAILAAAARLAAGEALTQETLSRSVSGDAGDADLIIRTGGEQRLSDFLLWESAYAELYFTDRMWPEFGAGELAEAMGVFQARERRFGGLGHPRQSPKGSTGLGAAPVPMMNGH